VEDISEVLSMLMAKVFDTEVINHKGETDRAGVVGEETRSVGRLGVPILR
jgi:hypothetical protein